MYIKRFNEIVNEEDIRKVPEKLMTILYDKQKREKMFDELLELNEDLSYDWFTEYFQEEHSQRKKFQQDFTPNQLSDLLGRLQGEDKQLIYEPTAGSGGLAIHQWYNNKEAFFQLEELSDRAIPFLLINLLIRGMNATVVHGDCINRVAKGVFFIQNNGKYSNLNLMPYNKITEEEFNIKFTDYRHKDIKEDLIKEETDWLGAFNYFNIDTSVQEIDNKKETIGELFSQYAYGLVFKEGINDILAFDDEVEKYKDIIPKKVYKLNGRNAGVKVVI